MAKKIDIGKLEPKIKMEPVRLDDKRCIRCRVLIVCEGETTEPLYFRSFEMMRNSSSIVFEINTGGGGINTLQIVDEAVKLKKEAEEDGNPYDSVWAVFDKDDFPDSDFDNAISKAEQQGIGCAWSNEAFELWYVYHFVNRTTPMSRSDYPGAITREVRKCGKKGYTYTKNDPKMRRILSDCGCDERQAIRWAENQACTFEGEKFHSHNPCTMVYKLVRQLRGEDKDFNKMIEKKLREK